MFGDEDEDQFKLKKRPCARHQTESAKPVCVVAHSHMDADVAERHSSGLSAVPSTAQPCGSKRDRPPAVREPRRIQTRSEHDLDAHGSCKQAGPVGWGELVTCDELWPVRLHLEIFNLFFEKGAELSRFPKPLQ
jgi:hypothetical protein